MHISDINAEIASKRSLFNDDEVICVYESVKARYPDADDGEIAIRLLTNYYVALKEIRNLREEITILQGGACLVKRQP